MKVRARYLLVLGFVAAAGFSHIAQALGPSALCHATDGTFTVCPDGHQEWSDVSPTFFPEAHSYLYADQADLDPLRATAQSPADTVMLLYDECGRTAPLGPNEYFLVSFKTVEVENGVEALKIYSIHIFTDGTIAVFENGVLQPPGRAPVVEGQRGTVGFGTSPNCPFGHVIAEFQDELSAAGGHSYSSDPLFWGSIVPPPPSSTFSQEIETKLFIGPIGLAACDPVGVLGPGISEIARLAAYMAFCAGTDAFFHENPPTGAVTNPLDARVLSIVNLQWTCTAGITLPVLGNVTPINALGGPEPLGFLGVANPIATANNILEDGTWAFVSSGRPNRALELGFQAHRLRFTTTIWHRVAGSISCDVDQFGNPTSTVTAGFTNATRFPSHRAYWSGSPANPPIFLLQGAFSNLWFLPPVGAP